MERFLDSLSTSVLHGTAMLVICLTLGCSSIPKAPTRPADADFAPAESVVPEGLATDLPPPDVLAPGDILDLHIVSDKTTDLRGLMVGTDGTIPVAVVGHVAVAGLSLAEASERVRSEMQKYDRFAKPNLILVRADGRRIAVLGSVDRPGVHPVTPGLRVNDVLALCGGPKTTTWNGDVFVDADLDAARIVRSGEAVPISLRLALQGDPKHNVHVHPGDVLWVPSLSSKRVSVLGEVDHPASLRYRPGMRLTEAVAAAGGANNDADLGDVRIIRGPLSKPRVYTASLKDLISGKATDVELAPGDVVFVTEHWYAKTTDVLRRLTPLLIAAGVVATVTTQ